MSTSSKPVVTKALAAALLLFARHGFNRTSMGDVAEAAGISRATLYVHFRDKRALFDGLAGDLVNQALLAMREAWHDEASFADNLAAVILAKDGWLHRLIHTSPHGSELLASSSEAALGFARGLDEQFLALLVARAHEAARAGRAFHAFGGVAGFAPFVAEAAAGFKHAVVADERYEAAIRTFTTIVDIATAERRR